MSTVAIIIASSIFAISFKQLLISIIKIKKNKIKKIDANLVESLENISLHNKEKLTEDEKKRIMKVVYYLEYNDLVKSKFE